MYSGQEIYLMFLLNENDAETSIEILSKVLMKKSTDILCKYIDLRINTIKNTMRNQNILKAKNIYINDLLSPQEIEFLNVYASLKYIEKFIEFEFEEIFKTILKKYNFKKDVDWSIFLNVENVRMLKICEKLSTSIIFEAYNKLNNKKSMNIEMVPLSLNDLKNNKFLKDVLFLYLIRYLELYNGQIYPMDYILKQVSIVSTNKKDIKIIDEVIDEMSTYPILKSPFKSLGYCLIMCITESRPNTKYEIKTLKETYMSCNFDVEIVLNPTKLELDEFIMDFEQAKYCSYNFFVFWFLAHYDETGKIIMANCSGDNKYSIVDIINGFSKQSFKLKPKLFHFDMCKWNKRVHISKGNKLF